MKQMGGYDLQSPTRTYLRTKSSDETFIRLPQVNKGTKKTSRLNNHFNVHVGE